MGALLGLVPPGAELREIASPRDVAPPAPAAAPGVWHVCHEIGAGSYFGYLWGAALADYFGLLGPHSHLASNLHADTRDEVRASLGEAPNGVGAEALGAVELLLTLRVRRQGGTMRHWVQELLVSTGAGHEVAYCWSAAAADFVAGPAAPAAETLQPARDWLATALQAAPREPGRFRAALLETY